MTRIIIIIIIIILLPNCLYLKYDSESASHFDVTWLCDI